MRDAPDRDPVADDCALMLPFGVLLLLLALL